MLPGFLTAIAASTCDLYSKFALRTKTLKVSTFVTLSYIWQCLFLLPAVPFLLNLDDIFFTPFYLFCFFAMTITAVIFSLMYYEGIKHEKFERLMPSFQVTVLFTVLGAFIFFPDERNILHVIFALIAGLAVLSIYIEKHHFVFNKYSAIIFGAAILWSIHNLLVKQLLVVMSPFTFVFLRSLAGGIIYLLIFGIRRDEIRDKRIAPLLIYVFLNLGDWLIRTWSIQSIGLVLTTLLLTLVPIMTMWGGHIFLKEKVHMKNIVATFVIIGAITTMLLV